MIKCPECFHTNNDKLFIQCAVCGNVYENKKQLWTFRVFKENLLIVKTYQKQKDDPFSWDIEENELQKIKEYFMKRYGTHTKHEDIFLSQIESTRHASIFFYYEYYKHVLFFGGDYINNRKEDADSYIKRMVEKMYYKYLEQFAWEREV